MADAKRVDAGSGVNIIDLLNFLGGKTTTTQNSADTSQLQQVLAQLQGQQDYSGLLASIFQQAAAQMPGLQARFANAVGARSGGNSAVQGALQKLLQDTTLRGQQQVVQQQQANLQAQGDVAGKIAQLTSRQTANTNPNYGNLATGLAGLQLFSKLSDSDVGKKAKDLFSGFGGNDTGANTDLSSAGDANPFADFKLDLGPMWDTSGSSDLVSGSDVVGDLSGLGDFFGGSDVADSAVEDSGLFDDIGGLFGFSNGGLVGRDGDKVQKGKSQKTKGYANGGEVTQRATGGRKSAAPTYTVEDLVRAIAQQTRTSLNPLQQQSPEEEVAENVTTDDPGSGKDTNPAAGFTFGVGPLGTAKASMDQAVATAAQKGMLGMMTGIGIPGLTNSPLGVLMKALRAGMTQQNAMDAINKAEDPVGALAVAQGWISPEAVQAMSTDSLAAAANAIAAISNNSIDSLDAALGLNNAFGTGPDGHPDISNGGIDAGADATGIDADGHGYNAGKDSSAADGNDASGPGSGPGTGGDGSDGSGGDGYSKGGRVPGKTDLTGGDTVHARLTRGEYVVSSDVVEALTPAFFDYLQAAFHEQVGV